MAEKTKETAVVYRVRPATAWAASEEHRQFVEWLASDDKPGA